MHTFFARHRSVNRPRRLRRRGPIDRMSRSIARAREGFLPARRSLASERGDTLIEVMVSAMLVALIVIATLSGFDETNKVSQDERSHNQASVLAAQSQEQLRSDPGSTLNALASTPHEYTQTVGGTTYKITQSATFVNGSGGSGSCTGSSSSTETSKNLEVKSSVTWARLIASGRATHPVTQSSVITPPDGSGLEIDVTNLGSPEEGVSGVSVLADGAETTTGEKGCVIYTGIPATATSVEAYRTGYVLPSGGHKYIAKEVSIAPNVITHTHVYLGHGGRITAEFKNGSTPVEGDTFVAYNSKMGVTPEFEVGSVEYGTFSSEGKYETQPGTVASSTTKGYSPKATTAVNPSYYPSGDLFPFTSAWTVYAGDCTENNPEKYSITPGSAIVPAGSNEIVSVPTSHVTLNLYKKTTAEPETTKQEVKITNLSCTKASPAQVADNAVKSHYEHYQMTSTTGHLEVPYQPFGEFEICLAYNNGSTHSTYTTKYTNTTEAGLTLENIYATGTTLIWTKTTSSSTTKC